MAIETSSIASFFHLTPAQWQIWATLAPAVVCTAYFVIGLLIYTVRYFIVGHYRDAEIEKRERTILTGLWIRLYFVWLTKPIWRFVLSTGIPANAITTLSVLFSFGSGIAFAAGSFAIGGWLYIFSGVCDFFDGRLARARGETSTGGAALDSILDRYSDSAVLAGLCWYFRDSWVLAAALSALVGSSLVPYIRAKAEAVGLKMTTGIMQRAERILYLGAPAALSPLLENALEPNNPHPQHRLAVAGVVLLAVSTQTTALQRFIGLLQALDGGRSQIDRPFSHTTQMVRNLGAAIIATGVDFVIVSALVNAGHLSAPWATAIGCAAGAVVNFFINRRYTFGSKDPKLPQMRRYAFVSFTSALLNSSGVAVFLLLPGLDYRIAWLLARVAVFVAWNFPLHRNYVFASQKP